MARFIPVKSFSKRRKRWRYIKLRATKKILRASLILNLLMGAYIYDPTIHVQIVQWIQSW